MYICLVDVDVVAVAVVVVAVVVVYVICIYNFDFRGARLHHEDGLRPGADAGQGGNVTLPLSGRA